MSRTNKRRRPTTAPSPSLPATPYIVRSLPFFDPLNTEALERLERQVDWMLENIGVDFCDDPQALEIWKAAGAKVTGTNVRADAALIRALCKKAPRTFTQQARNRAKSVRIGGENQVFAPVYGPPFVRDLVGGRRYGDMAAFADLVKLVYRCDSLHHSGFVTCEPCDIPVNKRHLDMLYTHMRYSDKPFLGAVTTKDRAEDCLAMAQILFGKEYCEQNCVIMGNVNTNSPLLVDKVVTEAIATYCGAHQGVVVVPFILSGAMGPLSTAASIVQAIVEAMMVCAYSQSVCAGAPFVLGNFLSAISLKSGAPTFGMPEAVLSNYVVAQLARRLGLPLRCGGSLTASKIEDAQAAYESADSMHSTMLAGANFVLHAAGWLEGGLCTGYEKLMMDADRLSMYQKLLKGLDYSEEAMAQDAYAEVKAGGHFLDCGHTMRHYKSALHISDLSDSENVESWEERGSTDMRQRAYTRWQHLLQTYEPPPMDDAVDEALREFIAKQKASKADMWY